MRVNLRVPYIEKDIAKSKGAKWDAVLKTWYVIDPADLQAFSMWLPVDAKNWFKQSTKPAKHFHKKKNRKAPVATGILAESCGCNVLPWEDCEHTTSTMNHV